MPTTENGAPYPSPTDPNNIPGDLQALAEWSDSKLGTQASINDSVMAAAANDPTSTFARQQSALKVADADVRWQTNALHSGGLVITEGDSTTDGAGTPPSNPRESFEKSMRAAYGDGGPGLHVFTNGVSSDRNAGFAKSGGLTYITPGDGVYGAYFIGGLWSGASASGESFGWQPDSLWDTARILYLKIPGGGTFRYRLNSTATATTVNSGTVNPDGTGGTVSTVSVGYVDITNLGGYADSLQFHDITGKNAVLGADFKIAARPRGYRAGSLAGGGLKLQQFAAMDQTVRAQWLSILNPAAIFNNLGMNDRLTRTAAQLTADLTTMVTTNKTTLPNVTQVIVSGNEPGDYETTNYKDYPAAKLAVARALDVAFYDERTVIGKFAQANASGLMAKNPDGSDDPIHPNLNGNRRRAAGWCTALGVPPSLPDPGRTPYAGASGTPSYFGSLTRLRGSWTSNEQTRVAYRIGLAENFPVAILTFKVNTQRANTGATITREFNVTVENNQNASNPNAVTDAGPVTSRLIHQNNAGDGAVLDVTLTAVVVSNQLEIRLKSGDYAGVYDISGEYVLTRINVTSKPIYENAV